MTKNTTPKQNCFSTLNDALEAEGLLEMWDCMNPGLTYGQTVNWTFQDGTKYGHYISVTRFSDGSYERPLHYAR